MRASTWRGALVMTDPQNPEPQSTENPSFTKLAMRNMVRKGKLSLTHFGLTALGFLGFIVLVAYLGRPQIPGT